MGESSKFERPVTPETGDEHLTPEEKNELYLERSKYLLEQLDRDLLTGLRNRKVFESELERVLNAIRGHRAEDEALKEAAIIFIDLDNFKQVNDTLGHLKGDAVLIQIARLLESSVREEDIVARFGGDEFYALLPHTNEHQAVVIAEKIRARLDEDPRLSELGVTASLGIRPIDASNVTDAATLIKHADDATYTAKETGKNKVKVYSAS